MQGFFQFHTTKHGAQLPTDHIQIHTSNKSQTQNQMKLEAKQGHKTLNQTQNRKPEQFEN